MCAPKIKKPKVEPIPVRAAAALPDSGDPAARQNATQRRRLTTSAMIFTNQGTIGSPNTSAPLGSSGL
jgi:hypothetical protein